MKKLFVGSLPFSVKEDGLRDLFSQAGTVESAIVIMDKMTGRSKGFGFVEMSSDEEAQKAVEMLNGSDVEGRNIVVSEARPQEDRPRSNFGGGDRGGYRN
ncbi:MAG: RNA-binding protein [Patescibacteria group bacterium]|jgi:RNA recognition motif-containing protein